MVLTPATLALRRDTEETTSFAIARLLGLAAVLSFVLGASHLAHAQSPTDGFNPGANDQIHAFAVQPDGKILVVGFFTSIGSGGSGSTARNRIARINVDGSVDTAFDPGANGLVRAIAVQPDGKIVVAGLFTTLGGGGTGSTARNYIGRLNVDGSLDISFDPGANGAVDALALQRDGKILIAGRFTMLGGGGSGATARSRIGRLNPDGSLDASFNPGANEWVETIAVQPDGKIVVAGEFTMLGGGSTGLSARNYIGRLNADGSIDGAFNPGANARTNVMALQADGKILVGGDFTALGGETGTTPRRYIGRLNAGGTVDLTFDPGVNDWVGTLVVQPDGKILVGGSFGALGGGGDGVTSRSRIGRLNTDGSLDTTFNPGANWHVYTFLVQSDGRILVGGEFTGLGGGTGTTTRSRIGRLYADGSLDADFNPGASSTVRALAVQADGKILVGGDFSTLGGAARAGIGRLIADGALDATFDPGTNNGVYAVALQADGKILVGGDFTTIGGGGTGSTTRNRIARLNSDGSVDTSFDPGADGRVHTIAVQPGGKILVGGSFTGLGGGTGATARNRIGRLNIDGSVDTSFDPGANNDIYGIAVQPNGQILLAGPFTMLGEGGTGATVRNRIGRVNADGSLDNTFDPGANGIVYPIAVQRDGKILVGGNFTTAGGGGSGLTARSRIARLNADGTVDDSFDPGANGIVYTISVGVNGRILLGGSFTTLGGGGTGTATRNYIGRLNADGSLDTTFDPGSSGGVAALAVQADGKVLVGGAFSGLGAGTGTTTRANIGRLSATDAALEAITVTSGGSIVRWSRSGTAPEFDHVTFETSTDGVTYTSLGTGIRVDGGWQWTDTPGQPLAHTQNLWIRARGYYETGQFNASGSMIQSIKNVYLHVPTATGTSIAATEDVAFSGSLTGSDLDGDTLTFSIVTNGSRGTATITNSTTGAFTYTPNANANGTDSFSFKVNDGVTDSSAATVTVTIAAVNDAPTITAVADQTILEDTGTAALAFTVSDDSDAWGLSATSSSTALVREDNGIPGIYFSGSGNEWTVTVTPDPDQHGAAIITLSVTDGALTSTTSFTVTVTPVNDAPTITSVANQTITEDTQTGALAFTIGDIDGDTLAVTASSSNTTLVPNGNIVLAGSGANRTVTVTPATNQFGTGTITLTSSDGGGLSATTSFTVTVASVNDAPTLSSIANTATERNTPVTVNVVVGDVDDGAASATMSGTSSNQTLVPDANLVFGGSNGDRTLTVSPVGSFAGTTTIAVTVNDGSLTATTSFVLTVGSYEPFTDDVLTAGATIVRAVHITELRSRIDVVRGARSLAPFNWTDPDLVAGTTLVTAVHIRELRTAVAEAFSASGQSAPTYTDSDLTPGVTPLRAAHIAELRSAVAALE